MAPISAFVSLDINDESTPSESSIMISESFSKAFESLKTINENEI